MAAFILGGIALSVGSLFAYLALFLSFSLSPSPYLARETQSAAHPAVYTHPRNFAADCFAC